MTDTEREERLRAIEARGRQATTPPYNFSAAIDMAFIDVPWLVAEVRRLAAVAAAAAEWRRVYEPRYHVFAMTPDHYEAWAKRLVAAEQALYAASAATAGDGGEGATDG